MDSRGGKGFHGEAWRYGVARRKKYRFRGEGVERKRGSAEQLGGTELRGERGSTEQRFGEALVWF